jgi:hypothetical protein
MANNFKKCKQQVDKFNTNYKDKAGGSLGRAGGDIEDAVKKISTGIDQLQNGRTTEGASTILEGIGSVSGALALAGPAGAAAGAILGILTSIITAILGALAPQQKTLDAKLKDIIDANELKKAWLSVWANSSLWNFRELDLESLSQKRSESTVTEGHADFDGWTWEYLKNYIGFDNQYLAIKNAFGVLQKYPATGNEWLTLFDITVFQANNFLLSFNSLVGLIRTCDGNKELEHFEGYRKEISDQLTNDIKSIYYTALNMTPFYAKYQTGGYDLSSYESIQRRIGIVGNTEWNGTNANGYRFSVVDSGTMFVAGRDGNCLVGRSAWEKMNLNGVDGVYCGNVFSHKWSPEKIITVYTNDEGTQLSACIFNDASGVCGENTGTWTPQAERGHFTYKNTISAFKILTLAISPTPHTEYYQVYALGLNNDYSLDLYDFNFDNPDASTKISGFHVSPEKAVEIYSHAINTTGAHSHHTPHDFWLYHTPSFKYATISQFDDFLAVQVGNLVMIRERANHEIVRWDLSASSFFWDDSIIFYQYSFISDGSQVCATNKGIYLRTFDLDTGAPKLDYDPAVITSSFVKLPSENALLARKLYSLAKVWSKSAP